MISNQLRLLYKCSLKVWCAYCTKAERRLLVFLSAFVIERVNQSSV